MNIYQDRILIGEVPQSIHQPGAFFNRLVGINLSSDGKSFEPIYLPLIRFTRRPGCIYIEVNSRRPWLLITLSSRYPFLTAFRYDWLSLEEDL